jgi:hypothetical protein
MTLCKLGWCKGGGWRVISLRCYLTKDWLADLRCCDLGLGPPARTPQLPQRVGKQRTWSRSYYTATELLGGLRDTFTVSRLCVCEQSDLVAGLMWLAGWLQQWSTCRRAGTCNSTPTTIHLLHVASHTHQPSPLRSTTRYCI